MIPSKIKIIFFAKLAIYGTLRSKGLTTWLVKSHTHTAPDAQRSYRSRAYSPKKNWAKNLVEYYWKMSTWSPAGGIVERNKWIVQQGTMWRHYLVNETSKNMNCQQTNKYRKYLKKSCTLGAFIFNYKLIKKLHFGSGFFFKMHDKFLGFFLLSVIQHTL